ncbi:MAG TPA: GntR family transcriptional regulator [Candidatus Aminicenantes bacterium]|nr:GntR family transcriptional regulator [Candidatus Aminicenantes bacterium]
MEFDLNQKFNYPLPRTLSDFIYNHLKELIINNKLKANQRLNEIELAKYFNVSRTPIREAILKLEATGFVTIDSRRHVKVKEASEKELREILQVLGALDRLVMELAVNSLTPKQIAKLERLADKMLKKSKIESIERYFELNEEFHNEILKAVPNKFLQEIVQYVNEKLKRYTYARIHAFKKPGALQDSLLEHHQIIEALKKKDKAKLQQLIYGHRIAPLSVPSYSAGLKEYFASNETKEEKKTR